MENLFTRFQATAERWPERPAVVMQGPEGAALFSYRELLCLAEKVAGYLHQQGVRMGDRCALLAENHARWCAAYLGIWRAGGVAVPLDTALRAEQLSCLLRDSGSRLLFTGKRWLPNVRHAAKTVPELRQIILLDEPAPIDGCIGFDRVQAVGETLPPRAPGRDDVAVILYTSGTTSDPKGVMLTHGNLLSEADGALQVIAVHEDDSILGVLPLFHALAQLANFLLPFTVGATVIFLEQINTTEILRAFRERGITVFCCVPQFFYLLHERVLQETRRWGRGRRSLFRALLRMNSLLRDAAGINLGPWLFRRVHDVLGRRMRLLVSGGSRFDARIGRDLHGLGFNILQGYGLTECAGAATLTPPDDNRIGSVGRPLPGVEVKLVTVETGREPGEGEVAIRGPIVMRGYHQRPEATAAALRDGWLHTGDLGTLDADGHLTITGRKKEVIVLSSGKNIYPEEIEAHYLTSPFIKELCVVPRQQRPREPLAERLHALVVPDMEELRQRKIVNVKEILRFEIEGLSAQLPSHQRILSYDIWPTDLPRTTTRKLKRYEIEKELAARAAEDREIPAPRRSWTEQDRAWKGEPGVAEALGLIAQAAAIPVDAVHPGDNLELDLGLDSMERVELLVALEQAWGRHLGEETGSHIYSVRELVDAIRSAPSPAGPAVRLEAGPRATPWAEMLGGDAAEDPALTSLLHPKTLWAAFLFVLLRMFSLLARWLLELRVEGREHLPGKGPFLLCPNHESYLDPLLLVSVLPFRIFRQLFFVGASEYFETPLRQWLAGRINVVPIDPDSNLVRAMQAGAFGLRHGKILVLFPEGERSIDGELKTFKKGAAILSAHLQVPIVPVALDGGFEVWPRGRSPQGRAPVRVQFGRPLLAPAPVRAPASAQEIEESYLRISLRVRQLVADMLAGLSKPATADAPAMD